MVDRPAPPAKAEEKIRGGRIQPTMPVSAAKRASRADPGNGTIRGVNYGIGQSVCPQCGSGADVRTVAELFAMLNGAQDGAMQQGYPRQQTGPDYPGTYPDYPAQGYQAPDSAGTNPDYPAQG